MFISLYAHGRVFTLAFIFFSTSLLLPGTVMLTKNQPHGWVIENRGSNSSYESENEMALTYCFFSRLSVICVRTFESRFGFWYPVNN